MSLFHPLRHCKNKKETSDLIFYCPEFIFAPTVMCCKTFSPENRIFPTSKIFPQFILGFLTSCFLSSNQSLGQRLKIHGEFAKGVRISGYIFAWLGELRKLKESAGREGGCPVESEIGRGLHECSLHC